MCFQLDTFGFAFFFCSSGRSGVKYRRALQNLKFRCTRRTRFHSKLPKRSNGRLPFEVGCCNRNLSFEFQMDALLGRVVRACNSTEKIPLVRTSRNFLSSSANFRSDFGRQQQYAHDEGKNARLAF